MLPCPPFRGGDGATEARILVERFRRRDVLRGVRDCRIELAAGVGEVGSEGVDRREQGRGLADRLLG